VLTDKLLAFGGQDDVVVGASVLDRDQTVLEHDRP